VLAVLLIVHWSGGKCDTEKEAKGTTIPGAGLNQTNRTNQTVNTTTQLASLCTNGLKDQDESDIDCGGSKCNGCGENKLCNVDTDCGTGFFCYQNIKCRKPSCTDGVKNQDETNADCGGKCGGYWWISDNTCHPTKEPSGKLAINLSVDASASELSGNVVLNSITMTLDNGLSKTLLLNAYVYALTASGKAIFPDQEGNNIAITEVTLDGISTGSKLVKVVNLTSNSRRTLLDVKPDEAYQILVEFKNAEGVLQDKKTWTNPV
jgi:hypothetical protein